MIGALITPGMIAGPLEQSQIERRADVLCYTTAPFEADTEITGPVTTHLFVSTSATDTDFTAKLALVWAGWPFLQSLRGDPAAQRPRPRSPARPGDARPDL